MDSRPEIELNYQFYIDDYPLIKSGQELLNIIEPMRQNEYIHLNFKRLTDNKMYLFLFNSIRENIFDIFVLSHDNYHSEERDDTFGQGNLSLDEVINIMSEWKFI